MHAGIPFTNGSHTDGIASSWAPATTSVGTAMSPTRSTTLQSLREPTTWNSLGPFMVW